MNRERKARVERVTHETQILVELDLDGIGAVEVATGVPFFDHMLAQLGKHGGLDLTVRAKGDVEIDAHHTVEDTAIALGQALREALGDKSGITRFGDALVPLDETLVMAAVDLSGRPYVVHEEPAAMAPLIGSYDTTLTRHIFESLARVGQNLPARAGAVRPQPAPHRGSPVQGRRAGAAHGRRGGPAGGRRTEHQGRAVTPSRGRAGLRLGKSSLRRTGPGTRRARMSGSRPIRTRRWTPTGWRSPGWAPSRPAWRACARWAGTS